MDRHLKITWLGIVFLRNLKNLLRKKTLKQFAIVKKLKWLFIP